MQTPESVEAGGTLRVLDSADGVEFRELVQTVVEHVAMTKKQTGASK